MGLIVDPRNLRNPPAGLYGEPPSDDYGLPQALQRTENSFVELPSEESMNLLFECQKDFDALSDYRARRAKYRNDLRGKQWEREMDDPENPGQTIKEKEYIKRQGRVPYVMNHVSPTVRNLVGQLLQNESERMAYAVNKEDDEAAEQMSVAMRGAKRINRYSVLEPDQFIEHLFGLHCWKVAASYIPELDRDDIQIDKVDPNRFFFNRDIEDRRLKGLRRIGELHDVTIDELVATLAESPEHEKELREVYGHSDGLDTEHSPYGFSAADLSDFYRPADPNKVRVVEVWCVKYEWVTLAHDPYTGSEGRIKWSEEELQMENLFRREMGIPELEIEQTKEPVWYVKYLSPQGHVLKESETPYWHQSHPYVAGFGMFFDGEIWGLIEDIQDPQRLVNRLTAAVDHMMAAAAKGVLVVDEEVIEESQMSLSEIADEWTKFNGVVALKLKNGMQASQAVQQITSEAIPAGVFNWLGEQKHWVQELSGVQGAQLGQAPDRQTPASLYAQQQTNASLTTLIFFDSFFQTGYELDKKIIQLIMQYYDRPRRLANGQNSPLVEYNPERVREVDFDVVVADTNDTATYRLQFEQELLEFLGGGHITFSQFLEISGHPKATQLQKLIERTNPLLQQQSALDTADPQLSGALMQAAEAGDVEARTLLQQAMERPPEAPQAAPPGMAPEGESADVIGQAAV